MSPRHGPEPQLGIPRGVGVRVDGVAILPVGMDEAEHGVVRVAEVVVVHTVGVVASSGAQAALR